MTLIEQAFAVREHAYAPYSQFKVGAALEASDGRVFTGCNIENASYGLTICAERVALFKAISEGVRDFKRIVIATSAEKLTPPCGACRQILWEFCGDFEVQLVNTAGVLETIQMKDLLPRAFDDRNLH